MLSASYGDIAQYTFLRMRNSDLKSQVQTLGQELTTGRTSNVTERLGGDFTYLSGIEHTLSKLDSYKVAVSEVTVLAVSMQSSIQKVHDNVEQARNSLLTLSTSLTITNAQDAADDARLQLDNSIDAINSSVGGRNLFSGTATSSSSLLDGQTILSALSTEISGLTSTTDIITAIDNWFDDPAGFDSVVYQGSDTALAPIDVGETDQVTLDVLATDPAFKQSLKAFAFAAITTEPGVTMDDGVAIELVRHARDEFVGSSDSLIELQSDIGFMEGRIENARTRNEAQITTLSITKNKMLEADPYETYAKLEEAQNQLQSLYVVTQKSFELSLLRYIS
ncbi:flagellar biosynthesis protein FlgL [Epibacterium sp. SM1969]|uniref:Flagellar biosynthesis protein FlgL n=1 Tax=Tritonibacter aquimaris TaxID=2663379 RepID=A0A844AXB2_9RHOB|nr:flagellin [Tritonibacter aquimaris]MQY41816.1 flagellar biosynthesis protein FlgL [Tritonibacter aquimaris]